MADDTLLTIGELARLTGLTVKTVRFWSDRGLVPPAARTRAGYRLYDREAVVRLGLVRTLRDLGVDLATVRRILAHEVTLAEVAGAHAAALDVRVRVLRLHRAVLRAVAARGNVTPEEIQLMHRLARLSADERRNLINDFIDDTFTGIDVGSDFVPMMRSAMPDLPDDPTQRQIDAWVELAELVQDPDFRAGLRRAATVQARTVAEHGARSPEEHRAMAALLRERVEAATASGIAPDSPDARPVVDELVAAYAAHTGRPNDPDFRRWLLDLLESSSGGYERYWRLLATINDWPAQPAVTPAAEWLAKALRSG